MTPPCRWRVTPPVLGMTHIARDGARAGSRFRGVASIGPEPQSACGGGAATRVLSAPPPTRAWVVHPRGRGSCVHQARPPPGLIFWGMFANHQLPVSQRALVASRRSAAILADGCHLGFPPRHPTTHTPPEGLPGHFGLQGEEAPDSPGRQGDIQGDDEPLGPVLLRVF